MKKLKPSPTLVNPNKSNSFHEETRKNSYGNNGSRSGGFNLQYSHPLGSDNTSRRTGQTYGSGFSGMLNNQINQVAVLQQSNSTTMSTMAIEEGQQSMAGGSPNNASNGSSTALPAQPTNSNFGKYPVLLIQNGVENPHAAVFPDKTVLSKALLAGDPRLGLIERGGNVKSPVWKTFRVITYEGERTNHIACFKCLQVYRYDSHHMGTSNLYRHKCVNHDEDSNNSNNNGNTNNTNNTPNNNNCIKESDDNTVLDESNSNNNNDWSLADIKDKYLNASGTDAVNLALNSFAMEYARECASHMASVGVALNSPATKSGACDKLSLPKSCPAVKDEISADATSSIEDTNNLLIPNGILLNTLKSLRHISSNPIQSNDLRVSDLNGRNGTCSPQQKIKREIQIKENEENTKIYEDDGQASNLLTHSQRSSLLNYGLKQQNSSLNRHLNRIKAQAIRRSSISNGTHTRHAYSSNNFNLHNKTKNNTQQQVKNFNSLDFIQPRSDNEPDSGLSLLSIDRNDKDKSIDYLKSLMSNYSSFLKTAAAQTGSSSLVVSSSNDIGLNSVIGGDFDTSSLIEGCKASPNPNRYNVYTQYFQKLYEQQRKQYSTAFGVKPARTNSNDKSGSESFTNIPPYHKGLIGSRDVNGSDTVIDLRNTEEAILNSSLLNHSASFQELFSKISPKTVLEMNPASIDAKYALTNNSYITEGVGDQKPLLFWKKIATLGLLRDFVREAQSNLESLAYVIEGVIVDRKTENIAQNSLLNISPHDAAKKLSQITNTLDLNHILKQLFNEYWQRIRLEQEKNRKELTDLKRKLEQEEHRSESLRKKNDFFKELIADHEIISASHNMEDEELGLQLPDFCDQEFKDIINLNVDKAGETPRGSNLTIFDTNLFPSDSQTFQQSKLCLLPVDLTSSSSNLYIQRTSVSNKSPTKSPQDTKLSSYDNLKNVWNDDVTCTADLTTKDVVALTDAFISKNDPETTTLNTIDKIGDTLFIDSVCLSQDTQTFTNENSLNCNQAGHNLSASSSQEETLINNQNTNTIPDTDKGKCLSIVETTEHDINDICISKPTCSIADAPCNGSKNLELGDVEIEICENFNDQQSLEVPMDISDGTTCDNNQTSLSETKEISKTSPLGHSDFEETHASLVTPQQTIKMET